MPDLNSVPASPHALAGSRRESNSQMPRPDAALNILPSNQSTVSQSRRASNASQPPHLAHASGPDANVVAGPWPIRHPRPLTAADLHIQLEKEQEAVVNRLTRELQLLRTAQNASTVSNTSSASGTTPIEQHPTTSDSGLMSGAGFSIPSSTSRRHNRTSSNNSSRSIRSTAATAGSTALSSTSHRALGTSPSWDYASITTNYFHGLHRNAGTQTQGQDQQLSPGLMPGTTRYEEAIYNRELLEIAMQENESLKQRVRELERRLRERRPSDTGSQPTSRREPSLTSTADLSNLSTRSLAGSSVSRRARLLEDDDEVDFGESASTVGQTETDNVLRQDLEAAQAQQNAARQQ